MITFDFKLFLSLFIAIAPPLLIARYFYTKLETSNNQKKLLYKLFLLGFFITLPVLSLEFLLGRMETSASFTILVSQLLKAFIIAGFCEELSKLSIVLIFAYKKVEFNQFINGVVYTIVVSMGLASLENLLYLLRGGLGLAIIRTFTALPMHAISAGIMGYYISKAKFSSSGKKERNLLFKGILYATLIHGLYDFLLSSNAELYIYASIAVYLLLITVLIILINKIKSAISKDLNNKQAELLSESLA